MKICMITTMTPSSENIRGTSALPYHIRMGTILNANVNGNDNFTIYTFNNNGLSDEKIAEVEKELKCSIKKVPLPKWFTFVFRFHLLFIRLFLKYPLHHYVKLPQHYVDEIKAKKPDLIWVYGAEWSKVVNQFDGFRRIHTLPDSEALYYYRMLGQRFVTHDWKQFWRCAFMYPKFLALERDYSIGPSIHYHLVGEEDVNFLRKMNPGIQARFIRHPHYEVRQHFVNGNGNVNGNINLNDNVNVNDNHIELQNAEVNARKFHQPKIKVLIAGQYNYYMKQEADLLIEQICNVNVNDNGNLTAAQYENVGGEIVNVLKEHYVFTFLGKGWEKHVETLRQAGYEVEHITFALDYIEEIVKHDIQITPIAIGTGTKGKVLDALANGLLVIGTPYAMENIAVENGVSCIVYRDPQEVIKILLDIVKNDNGNDNETLRYENSNRRKYEEIAAEGQRQVLKHHDRKLIAEQLFGVVTTGTLTGT